MNTDERTGYVLYRLETTRKTFEAARVLAANGFWNSVVNRLYYTLYYAVNALLVANDIQPKSHAGTKTMFSQHFVKTYVGIFVSEVNPCPILIPSRGSITFTRN